MLRWPCHPHVWPCDRRSLTLAPSRSDARASLHAWGASGVRHHIHPTVCDSVCTPCLADIVSRGLAFQNGRVHRPGMVWGEDILLDNPYLQQLLPALALSYLWAMQLDAATLLDVLDEFPQAARPILRLRRWWIVRRALVRQAEQVRDERMRLEKEASMARRIGLKEAPSNGDGESHGEPKRRVILAYDSKLAQTLQLGQSHEERLELWNRENRRKLNSGENASADRSWRAGGGHGGRDDDAGGKAGGGGGAGDAGGDLAGMRDEIQQLRHELHHEMRKRGEALDARLDELSRMVARLVVSMDAGGAHGAPTVGPNFGRVPTSSSLRPSCAEAPELPPLRMAGSSISGQPEPHEASPQHPPLQQLRRIAEPPSRQQSTERVLEREDYVVRKLMQRSPSLRQTPSLHSDPGRAEP